MSCELLSMQVGCLLLPYYGNGLAGIFAVSYCNLFASIYKAVMNFVYCAVVAWQTLLGVGFACGIYQFFIIILFVACRRS